MRYTAPLSLAALLAASLVGPLRAQDAPDFGAAKRSFERAIKTDRMADRLTAIRLLRATDDPDAIKVFQTGLHRVRKDADSLEKKLRPLAEKRSKASAELGERLRKYYAQPGSMAPPKFPAGLGANYIKDIDELSEKIAPLEAQHALEYGTKEAILGAIGDLITGLAPEAQVAHTNDFLALFDKVRKEDDRVVYLEILGSIQNPQAVLGLAAIATNDPEPDMRVRALDALADMGDSRGADAAVHALADDYWSVRAAGIRSLMRFGSLDAIPLLVDHLEKEDGRLTGDVIQALSLMSGVTFHESATLWRKWWQENESKLRSILQELRSGDSVQVSNGMSRAAECGFLLGAREIMDLHGLSENAIRLEEARRKTDPELTATGEAPGGAAAGGVEAAEQEASAAQIAVGETISSADSSVREAAFQALVMRPFRRTRTTEKRHALIRLMGYVASHEATTALGDLVDRDWGAWLQLRHRGEEISWVDWKDQLERRRAATPKRPDAIEPKEYDMRRKIEDRVVALGGVGRTGSDQEVDLVYGVFENATSTEGELVAASKALAAIQTAKSTKWLILALDRISNIADAARRSQMSGVGRVIVEALKTLTREDRTTVLEWRSWWNEKGDAFRTERELARANAMKEGKSPAEAERGVSFYGIRTYSKRMVYVLDVSGSMIEKAGYENEERTKIEVAKFELLKSIKSLPSDAAFNIIFYSSDYRLWKKNLVEATADIKQEAEEWIKKVEAAGGTNIYDSLEKSFEMSRARGSKTAKGDLAIDTVYFLSDGEPTAGKITDPNVILREILDINRAKQVQIHCIGVGKEHNAAFMKSLAAATGGTYVGR